MFLVDIATDYLGRTQVENWDYADYGTLSSTNVRLGVSEGLELDMAFTHITLDEGDLDYYNSVDLGARFQVLEGYSNVTKISLITFLRWYTVKDLFEAERPKLYLGFATLTLLGDKVNLTTNLAAHWLSLIETYSLYYNLNFTYAASPVFNMFFENYGNWNNNPYGANFSSHFNAGMIWNPIRGLAIDLRGGYGFSSGIREFFVGPGITLSNVDRPR